MKISFFGSLAKGVQPLFFALPYLGLRHKPFSHTRYFEWVIESQFDCLLTSGSSVGSLSFFFFINLIDFFSLYCIQILQFLLEQMIMNSMNCSSALEIFHSPLSIFIPFSSFNLLNHPLCRKKAIRHSIGIKPWAHAEKELCDLMVSPSVCMRMRNIGDTRQYHSASGCIVHTSFFTISISQRWILSTSASYFVTFDDTVYIIFHSFDPTWRRQKKLWKERRVNDMKIKGILHRENWKT